MSDEPLPPPPDVLAYGEFTLSLRSVLNGKWVVRSHKDKRPNPTGLVPGGLIEFSFHSFVEFRREKLQSNDTGAPDDFLRHAGDHIVP